jgi:bifunctional non-homologous end joining protein LigD
VALSFPVDPMKAVLGKLPAGEEWAFEVKWDGYRTLAFVGNGRVRLQSSSGRDVTASYPELGDFARGVNARQAIIDTELVVLDDDGRPRFELVQQHKRQAALYAFDVLSIDGSDSIELAYEQRRQLLTDLIEPGENWVVPVHRIGDGEALLAATAAQQLEGVMAKRLGSTYQPGRRSPNWRKVKNRVRAEVVIGGFSPGTGNRSSTFGSLLVGRWEDDRLAFAGGVGTGFDQRRLEELTRTLRSLANDECPFDPLPPTAYRRGATWVRPELVAVVEITELTNEGYVRQASFVDLADAPCPQQRGER